MKAPRTLAAIAAAALLASAGIASADASGGTASAFGATITVNGSELSAPTPTAFASIGQESSDTVIDVPADPVAISGTLMVAATSHEAADVPSALTVNSQQVPGPYNAMGVATVEGLDVLVNQLGASTSLLTATAVRAEAAAVCSDGVAAYSANSEIVDLQVAGENVPLDEPLETVIDMVNGVLDESGLDQVVDIERNVVVVSDDGAWVDALVVTLLSALGEPLAEVRIAHAEVGTLGCSTPPACSDAIDNDGDGVIDADDPGCHTDDDAGNPDSYDPNDDDETDAPAPPATSILDSKTPPMLPTTGSDSGAATVAAAMVLAAGGFSWLRRRLVA